MLMYSFNTSCGTYRHENGGLDVAVVGVDHAGAGIAAGGLQVEGESVGHFPISSNSEMQRSLYFNPFFVEVMTMRNSV